MDEQQQELIWLKEQNDFTRSENYEFTSPFIDQVEKVLSEHKLES